MDGAWPVVQLISDGIKLFLAVNRQIRALGQVLPDQPVDVLATAPLSRAVRVTEVHLDARVGAQFCIPGHLLALVVNQRLAHRLGNAAKLAGKAFQGRCGGVVRKLSQHHQARVAFHHTPTAERLPAPLMRAPSQCPGNPRSLASGRRT
jgi:hypothetical protein